MKNCDEMVNSLLKRRDQYMAGQKRKRKVLTRTVTSMCCVCLVALLGFGVWGGAMAMHNRTEEKGAGVTDDPTNETNNMTNESEDATKQYFGDIPGEIDIAALRARPDYKEIIGESFDVVLGEVMESGEAIMTNSNYEPIDENGEVNKLQKPYYVKVVRSYKGNIKEESTVSVVTSFTAKNRPKTNKFFLKVANAEDDFASGKQYLFILSANTEVINRWGKNAYYLELPRLEGAFSVGANGEIYSYLFDIDMDTLADYVASAEEYISEQPDYDKIQAKISARKAAE